jgi:hypothetical protein
MFQPFDEKLNLANMKRRMMLWNRMVQGDRDAIKGKSVENSRLPVLWEIRHMKASEESESVYVRDNVLTQEERLFLTSHSGGRRRHAALVCVDKPHCEDDEIPLAILKKSRYDTDIKFPITLQGVVWIQLYYSVAGEDDEDDEKYIDEDSEENFGNDAVREPNFDAKIFRELLETERVPFKVNLDDLAKGSWRTIYNQHNEEQDDEEHEKHREREHEQLAQTPKESRQYTFSFANGIYRARQDTFVPYPRVNLGKSVEDSADSPGSPGSPLPSLRGRVSKASEENDENDENDEAEGVADEDSSNEDSGDEESPDEYSAHDKVGDDHGTEFVAINPDID